MHSESVKVVAAASLLGGLLICIVGCGMPGQEQSREGGLSQVNAEGTPSATLVPSQEVVVPAATSTPTLSPQTPTPEPTPTSTVAAMPIPTPESGPFAYHTISEGQTLGYIALLYETELDSLVKMNKLAGPSSLIQIGQVLRVPVQTDNIAPSNRLLPDSEVVYGPSYIDFDIVDFVNQHGGFLASYREVVEGEELGGAEIVERVAEQFSVGPRLLLALLEHYGGWVTSPTLTEDELNRPLGPRNPRGGNLHLALGFTANRINAGYYGYKRDGFWIFHLPDGSQAISAQGVNAGTVGLQNILAIHSDFETWQQKLGEDGFMTDYRALFGDPLAKEFAPVVPIDLVQPPLSLPWRAGQGFYYTSGPHGAFADGSAWAAVDFGPPDVIGNCFYSNEATTAAASGVVVVARQGEVQVDLDGDGNIQTGWVLLYLHLALDFDTPVQIGQHVAVGDVIGYPSCEGGLANSSHLHLARRYNGEWIDAGGPVPMDLAGWVVQPNLTPYEGIMAKADQVRTACECWDAEHNLIVNEPLE
jgi:murein DD-endopeptidase MepM/ murein hydrolase activator NlpD